MIQERSSKSKQRSHQRSDLIWNALYILKEAAEQNAEAATESVFDISILDRDSHQEYQMNIYSTVYKHQIRPPDAFSVVLMRRPVFCFEVVAELWLLYIFPFFNTAICLCVCVCAVCCPRISVLIIN